MDLEKTAVHRCRDLTLHRSSPIIRRQVCGEEIDDVILNTFGALLGTLIAIYSPTKKAAMQNILPFCIGMLLTYYATAMLTQSVYGWTFIIGWTIFAFLSPVMAYFAWMTKEWGLFPKIIGVGIVLVSILSSVLLFDRLRLYDLVIDGMLIYFVFFKRIDRHESQE